MLDDNSPIDVNTSNTVSDDIHDAYSLAVMGAVEKAGPAVVHVGIANKQGRSGMGSGLVIASDGLILTNSHVVNGATQILVTMADGQKSTARILGEDPHTDIAVLRTDNALIAPSLSFQDSKLLKVGQLSVALGNPLGFEHSVTAGVVSAIGRSLRATTGRVIGINTAVIRGAQGICFSVAANTALDVVTQVLRYGRVRRASLGIEGANTVIPRHISVHAGVTQQNGVRVMKVLKASPAEQAGVQSGDLLIAIDDQPVQGIDDLLRLLNHEHLHADVKVTLLRKGERRDRYVAAVERKD
jgi:S1-C subfamily serine protease